MCPIFLGNPKKLIIFGVVMSVKKNYLKKYTTLYVVLSGYGKGATHCICNHV